ncbi:MAG TPA: hypothetical protein VGY31_01990 [Terriglobia bacterium]|nr:hypothetical protein [Terriglobia bacterium]
MREFSERKYGFIALGLCIAEFTFIWGSLALIYTMGLWGHAPHWLEEGFRVMYLAGVAAPAIAVLGTVKDSRRGLAGLALLLSLLNLVVCTLPLASLR